MSINYAKKIIQQQQQQPSLIPLSGVGYMDQITPYCSFIKDNKK